MTGCRGWYGALTRFYCLGTGCPLQKSRPTVTLHNSMEFWTKRVKSRARICGKLPKNFLKFGVLIPLAHFRMGKQHLAHSNLYYEKPSGCSVWIVTAPPGSSLLCLDFGSTLLRLVRNCSCLDRHCSVWVVTALSGSSRLWQLRHGTVTSVPFLYGSSRFLLTRHDSVWFSRLFLFHFFGISRLCLVSYSYYCFSFRLYPIPSVVPGFSRLCRIFNQNRSKSQVIIIYFWKLKLDLWLFPV